MAASLALLPELRQLGPAYFALGASTELFNNALDFVFTYNEDFHGALDLLIEMEREVIESNAQTLRILLRIVQRTKAIKAGLYGSAVRHVWHTDRNMTALRDIESRANALVETFSKEERSAVKATIPKHVPGTVMRRATRDDNSETRQTESSLPDG